MKATCVTPVFQVVNLKKAIDFYTNALGFEQDFIYGEPAYYAGVRKDSIAIHLNQASESRQPLVGKGIVFIFCDEVDAYCEKVKQLGAVVVEEPEDRPYGVRDFGVKDIDGNTLCFGCSLEES